MGAGSNYMGIDFGTSNSRMAVCDPQGRAKIIKSAGEDKIPSLVYFGEDRVHVGKYVENLLEDSEFFEEEVRRDTHLRTVKSIKRNLINPPRIPIPGNPRNRPRPVDVVAEVLKKLKRDAEEGYFREAVERVVLTHPAVFDYKQRNVLRDAATIAGFREVELLAEPTAAALSVIEEGRKVGKGVLVYDLGAGTLDLAVLVHSEDGSLELMPPQGNSHFGGDDFDQEIYRYLEQNLGRPTSAANGTVDLAFLRRCRDLKVRLTDDERAEVSVILRSEDGTTQFPKLKIDRETFEHLIQEKVESSVKMAAEMLEQARDKVDTVVLIGGSSRVPLIKRKLKETLPIEPRDFSDADYAVVLGAAYRAHELWGSDEGPQPVVPDVRGKTLHDAEQIIGTDFELAVGDTVMASDPKDTILQQDPAPNERICRGARVTVVLSSGFKGSEIEVPNIIGLNTFEAREVLDNAGLKLGDSNEAPDSDFPGGRIIRQEPAAGLAVAPGTSLNVVLSAGHERFELVRTLAVDGKSIWSVAISRDGSILVSGDDAGTIQLWDLRKGNRFNTLFGHRRAVRSVAISADGRLIASGGDDQTIRLWKASTGELVLEVRGHVGAVRSVAISADGRLIASGGDDRAIRLWKASTGELVLEVQWHAGAVRSVAISADGRLIASGGDDRAIRLYDLRTGDRKTIENRGWWVLGWVHSAAISSNGSLVASGDGAGNIRLWNTNGGDLARGFRGHKKLVRSVAISTDGRLIASGGEDREVKLWNAVTGDELQTLSKQQGSIHSIAISSDGRFVASGDSAGVIKIWGSREVAGDRVSDKPQDLPDEASERQAQGRPLNLPD